MLGLGQSLLNMDDSDDTYLNLKFNHPQPLEFQKDYKFQDSKVEELSIDRRKITVNMLPMEVVT